MRASEIKRDRLCLVADVGGTNTRLALANGTTLASSTIRRYSNVDFPNLEAVLQRFINDENCAPPKATCIAVAGPVQDGTATLTNLDWSISLASLASATQSRSVSILNDLQAQGHALAHLDQQHVHTVQMGNAAEPSGTRLMVGVGTGFNSASVIEVGNELVVAASETGHANVPVRTEQDFQLSQALSDTHGFPAIEEILSGRGLERIYRFLLKENMHAIGKSAAEIMASCESRDDAIAIETGKTFSRVLGTVCGNLSLIQLPLGGVFLVGGVSRAFAPFLRDFGFAQAFRDKGRFSEFMDQFSVHIVEDDYAALIGCAAYIDERKTRSNEAVV